MTFRELAELWTDGELHRRYPDHVKAKKSALDDVWRLDKYVYGAIGSKPLRDVTLEDAEHVMRGLNAGLAPASRRQVAQVIHRVMAMAVYPCRLISSSPIPRGWLPSAGKKVAFPVLFPSEDAELLQSPDVPLVYRLLYGFMHREGVRRGEAQHMTWADLDLEHGVVRQDENKTDHPRWWKLGPGVAAALFQWKKLQGDPKPADLVFVPVHGSPVDFEHLADRVREHIAAAGLVRPELLNGSANRRHFTAHCLRHSFVTRSLSTGKTDDWVRSRTGHRSNELLRYREVALSLTELDLGEVLPLAEAIPELRVGQKVGHAGGDLAQASKKRAEKRSDSNPVLQAARRPNFLGYFTTSLA